jgi:hypothetical protein
MFGLSGNFSRADLAAEINYDFRIFRLTEISTPGSLSSITGANRPTSGYCPLDGAPTADPRMLV